MAYLSLIVNLSFIAKLREMRTQKVVESNEGLRFGHKYAIRRWTLDVTKAGTEVAVTLMTLITLLPMCPLTSLVMKGIEV